MKRIIVAFVLIGFTVLYIITGNIIINKTIKKETEQLEKCKTSFQNGENEKNAEEFKKEWDTLHGKLALFVNHGLLDGISSEATALPVYAKEKESADFYACIAKIERFFEQIKDEERITPESFY